MRLKFTRPALAIAATFALIFAAAGPAAASQYVDIGTKSCNSVWNELIVASKTTGYTNHVANGNVWDKGYKNNAGATTYTGGYWADGIRVTSSILITSAGTRCS